MQQTVSLTPQQAVSVLGTQEIQPAAVKASSCKKATAIIAVILAGVRQFLLKMTLLVDSDTAILDFCWSKRCSVYCLCNHGFTYRIHCYLVHSYSSFRFQRKNQLWITYFGILLFALDLHQLGNYSLCVDNYWCPLRLFHLLKFYWRCNCLLRQLLCPARLLHNILSSESTCFCWRSNFICS